MLAIAVFGLNLILTKNNSILTMATGSTGPCAGGVNDPSHSNMSKPMARRWLKLGDATPNILEQARRREFMV